MDQLDIAIVQYVNSFAGRSPVFDTVVLRILHLATFKMLPIMALMVWLWFSSRDARGRKIILDGIIGGFLSLVATRVIQNLLPHRPRPALSGQLEFTLPVGGYTNDWSSFPSDTAALAFALAFAAWRASRPLGTLALLWATFIVTFPRLYGGFHYPSDIIAGALIGIVITLAYARFTPVSQRVYDFAQHLRSNQPGFFYAVTFVVAFQTATYFADVRSVGQRVWNGIGKEDRLQVHVVRPGALNAGNLESRTTGP